MNDLKTAMNILIDIRPLMDERYSGVAEYTVELLRAIFMFDQTNNYWLFYNSARDIRYRLPVFNQPNVRVIRTRFPNKILNYAFLKIFQRPYFDRLIGEKIDIFFMPHFNFAAWSPSVTSVLAVHDISFLHYQEFFSWRKNIWHRLLGVKKLIGRFSKIVTLSENTRVDVINTVKVRGEKVTTFYSGISSVFKKYAIDNQEIKRVKEKYRLPDNFLLFLGTVEPRKNIEGLIRAFEIVKQRQPSDLKLVIAGGRGWKSKPIYEAAAKSSQTTDIIFLGYVEAYEKVFLYNLATLFVYPSFYEGFGFPHLEAMACGVPTIVSAVSSLPEIVEGAAIMIDPYNPQAIATAIVEILNDTSFSQSLGEKGRQQAEKFTWEKTARQYVELFTSLHKE